MHSYFDTQVRDERSSTVSVMLARKSIRLLFHLRMRRICGKTYRNATKVRHIDIKNVNFANFTNLKA